MTLVVECVDGLFEMDLIKPSGDIGPVGELSGGKTFRRFDMEQGFLLPPSFRRSRAESFRFTRAS